MTDEKKPGYAELEEASKAAGAALDTSDDICYVLIMHHIPSSSRKVSSNVFPREGAINMLYEAALQVAKWPEGVRTKTFGDPDE